MVRRARHAPGLPARLRRHRTASPARRRGSSASFNRSARSAAASRVVAEGGAGHAARRVAESVAEVTALVTLGTPLGPVAFSILTAEPAASTLRLLDALLPAEDPADPFDPDLARGRDLVRGLTRLADTPALADELAPPATPPPAPRAGLEVHAVFGNVTPPAIKPRADRDLRGRPQPEGGDALRAARVPARSAASAPGFACRSRSARPASPSPATRRSSFSAPTSPARRSAARGRSTSISKCGARAAGSSAARARPETRTFAGSNST